MKNSFPNISEFVYVRDSCVFCGTKLKITLTNYILNGGTTLFKSVLNKNQFNFGIKYWTAPSIVDVSCSIDINTNDFTFKRGPINTADTDHIIETFEMYKPHIVLSCPNKECMNYSIHSNFLTCSHCKVSEKYIEKDFVEFVTIRPFLMYFESVNVGKYWVQSDYIYNTTRIISISNPDGEPIETPFMNFETFDSNKLKNRVLTIVTFT